MADANEENISIVIDKCLHDFVMHIVLSDILSILDILTNES